ncbi:MAG: DUF1223 domain-containing protein [Chitinophagaceae bacterium]
MMKGKLLLPVIVVFLAVLLTAYGFRRVSRLPSKMHVNAGKGFAVVELFTSEGCSSCPAADAAIERLLKKDITNVYILVYHVDYWNRLGWTDQFSQSDFSDRQSQYAHTLELNTIYTPQVIVNGTTEFVGSDENKLAASVENNLSKNIGQPFIVQFERNRGRLSVHYEINNADALRLNLAVIQSEATVLVKRGENGGKKLHHVNIVRILKTIEAKASGGITIDIPEELATLPLQLIAYTQDKKTLRVMGAEKRIL